MIRVIHNWFGKYKHNTYVRVALLASLAAVIAFSIGSLLAQISAVVAAITAIISIRPTFHDAAKEAFRQVIGTIFGAATALGLTIIFDGFNSIILLASLLVGFLAARLMKLGEEGAITIAITIILVTGVNMNTDAVEARFLGVVLGALIALPFSFYASAGTPTSRAMGRIQKGSETITQTLNEISDALAGSENGRIFDSSKIQEWALRVEEVRWDLVEVRKDIESAIEGYRWSPLINKQEVEQVLRQVHITDSSAVIVIGMCKDLLVISEKTEPLPKNFYDTFSDFFESLADVVEEQAETAMGKPAQLLSDNAESVESLNLAEAETKQQVRSLDETMPLILGGSLLQDGIKLKNVLLDQDPDQEEK
jgi:hypothetical protein